MTQKQFDAKHGGDMVFLTCENHPETRWATKKLSVGEPDEKGKRRWNAARSLFYSSHALEECDCSADVLYVVIDEKEEEE